ncbi:MULTISPECIES: hypothetical protein [Shewanella]|uniref:hypothetical protein n=1 Tax=Shewanella TaxID=22 RepID=UPI000F41FBF2|nr:MULTISPECIES: hypothetical protein [Shewanella]AYV11544.1 hypothetical protein EEY24_00820 [Shewanella algae]
MVPEFDAYQSGWGSELLCPNCGFNYLHHEHVEIFERGEDQRQGVHVTVADGKATFDTSLDGNPSSRRHGLLVRFWCEGCKAKPVLTISQHKGNTVVDFIHSGEVEE